MGNLQVFDHGDADDSDLAAAALDAIERVGLKRPKGTRDDRGRYLPGHGEPGPGRPSAVIERAYVAILAQACTLEDWREIVAAQVSQAKAGDVRAAEWLSRRLLGTAPPSLTDCALADAAGVSPDDEMAAAVELALDRGRAPLFRQFEYSTVLSRAAERAEDAAAEAERQALAEERKRKREARRHERIETSPGAPPPGAR